MTIAILTSPLHGALSSVNNLTGAFTYTPNLNYNGPDSFTYQLSDGTGVGNVATVFLTVNPVNDPPVANPDPYSVDEDGVLTVSALTGVLNNDTDVDGDPLTAVLDAGPSNAAVFTFTGATGAFSYTPNANFNGVDSFTYHARDGALNSATVTVAITVNSVNDVPSFTKGPNQHVVGGAPTTVANWATAISSGPPNESAQTLTFLVTTDHPEFFTAQPAVSPSGTLTFDPAPNANGVATVTVRLMDSGGTTNGGVDTSAPQTFTIRVVDLIVNSANDVDDLVCNATHCSLREAITFANVSPNLNGAPDTIRFAIPGAGAHTIAILSALPAVAEPVVIDATTQPGYAGQPLVELNGTSAGLGTAGLRLGAGSTIVAGFAINRFEGHGIEITGAGSNTIVVNFVGTDPTGLLARPNGGSGIRISGSPNNGLEANVVSGNGRAGVRLEAGADLNVVESNWIGVGRDGTTPVPNGENGVLILSGSSNVLVDNTVAHNNTQGVQISAGLHNEIVFNSIHSNGLLGIELGADGVTPNDAGDADSGANGLQNYPVLTRATTSPTTTGISGTFSGAPNTSLFMDYYVSDTCDPSGYGEGASQLDSQTVTTDAGGQAVIQISSGFPATTAGKYLTATATGPQGDTSEFSACRKIDPLPTLTLTGGETAGVLTINEGNPIAGPPTQALTFFVQLSSPSALPVSVTYQTTDGTAQSPSDYLSLSGSLLFAPGETLKQLVVQTVLDNDPETDETFTLSLGVPTNAVPAQSQIQIVLKDDDGAAGPLSLSVADVGVSEPRTGVRSAGLVVSLSDPAFHTVWVDYHTVNGTATSGLDYTPVSGQLVFQPGDQTKTVPVDVLADSLREGKETFFLVLTNPQGAILGRGQGTATVADPGSLFTLKPCRLSDSRQGSGAFAAGELRTFTMTGSCGVPATAVANSANLTVTQPVAPGFIEIFPSDKIAPATSVLNFVGGQTRANNTIIVLSPTGQATIKNVSNGTTHVIIDVNGYFE
jgi:CSLREA domain-containing protein